MADAPVQVLTAVSNLDQCFASREQPLDVRPDRTEQLLEMLFRCVAGGDPEDLWRRTVQIDERGKISVFGQNHRPRLTSALEDCPIGGIQEPKVTNVGCGGTKCAREPSREPRGKLGIHPDNHAAMMG